jgi:F-type H+-transporting ATPase subunit c
MSDLTIIAIVSIIMGGITMAIGSIGPAIGEAWSLTRALNAIAQQPDASDTIIRTLFVGLAMIESLAIFCLVIAIVLIFTNPFWEYFIAHMAK